jgi:hypothetical protein
MLDAFQSEIYTMSQTLILMLIGLGMAIVWFFASFVLMYGGHETASALALGFSALGMVGFILTFATQGDE